MSAHIIPDGWGVTALDDIVSDISYGYTAKSNNEEVGPKLLRITDIQDNKVDWKGVPYCEIPYEKKEKYLLQSGDLVFARTGATVGKSFLIKGKIPDSIYASYLIRVRCLLDDSVDYLSYFFKTPDYWRQITDFSAGIGQPNVNGTKLKKLTVPVAPLAEQREIADRLDTLLAQVDTLRGRLDALPAILKRFRQSVLAAAVSGKLTEEWRGTEHLEGWINGELKDFIQKPTYGTSSKSQKEGKVPVLRMGNLQNGRLDWTDLVYTSDDAEIEKYRLEKGDVLFNRTNSPELVGKTSIFKGERDAIYAGYLIRVKCLDSLIPDFLNYHLNSPSARQYCRAVKSDGVSQSNINAKKLGAYPLHCPPIEEQTEIVRRVEQLFAFADQVEERVKQAQSRVNHLTQSILAKAFRGELTADWREQHPELISGEHSAEALLARIQAERAAQAPAKRTRKKKASA